MKGWKRDNCLFYAARKAAREGKYVTIRISFRLHKWPICHYHYLVIPKNIVDLYAESYVPDADTLGDWPMPLFKGHVKKGDKP